MLKLRSSETNATFSTTQEMPAGDAGQKARHPSKPGQFPICMSINYSIHAASLLGPQLCGRHEDRGEREIESAYLNENGETLP